MRCENIKNKNRFIESYLGTDDFNNNAEQFGLFYDKPLPIKLSKRLETRTRKENAETALSFAVHDPLWMLTRQWQFGEFKGDDCGSAIWAKVKIGYTEIASLCRDEKKIDFNRDDALEYRVERMNMEITHSVRVESAYRLKKMIDYSDLKDKKKQLYAHWQYKYPIALSVDTQIDPVASDKTPKECIAEIKKRKNKHQQAFLAAFGNRSFDGYRVFIDIKSLAIVDSKITEILTHEEQKIFLSLCNSYATWFHDTYLPADTSNRFWTDEKLGYEFSVSLRDGGVDAISGEYSVEDYHSGHLSWYSFDAENKDLPKYRSEERKEERIGKSYKTEKNNEVTNLSEANVENKNEKYFTFIPVLAEFPGSPNKRLWTFEDARISMGNSELSAESLANAVILQYTTMYGNDWLITPMEINAGMISQVKGIVVTDVFGNRYFIDRPAGETSSSPDIRYSGKWEMFTISKKNAYETQDFTTDGCLFFPPSIARTEESAAIEEVQFLRDEMANMLWAVETKINDGCGKSLDGDSYAAEVGLELEALSKQQEDTEEIEADYSYLFQNSVPINWIPFSPVKFNPGEENAIREIRFQRSVMPLFIKDRFEPIRPCTSLMRTGINENDEVTKHKFINEEEILVVGTKVTLTNQRTRWFKGKTFNWLGAKKEICRTQANSGLSFDELVEVVSKSASEVDLRDRNKMR